VHIGFIDLQGLREGAGGLKTVMSGPAVGSKGPNERPAAKAASIAILRSEA